MLSVSREIGGGAHARKLKYRSPKNKNLRELNVRFHARACRIVAEMIVLLQSGLADGAMARWRTLHETWVVASVVNQFGEEAAVRYFEHQHIESKRGLDEYKKVAFCLDIRRFQRLSPS